MAGSSTAVHSASGSALRHAHSLKAQTFYLVLGSALAIGGLVGAIFSVSAGSGFASGLLFVAYMLAAAAIALIVGLIFGVPRARDAYVAAASERYSSNSNLEQISDWLTKLLVGVGLVQLSKLPGAVQDLGAYLAGNSQVPNASAFYVTAVVYGTGIGFVAGYLWTRLRLRVYLESSDVLAAAASKVKLVTDNLRRQNEANAQPESGTEIDRAAEAAVYARQTIGGGSVAPILWVDDVPDNNRAIVESLRALDVEVQEATSTQEGIEFVNRRNFGVIITDLGRQESGVYNPVAGSDLIRAIREKDRDVPIIVYGTHRASRMRGELESLGANLVTTRATEVFAEAMRRVTTD